MRLVFLIVLIFPVLALTSELGGGANTYTQNHPGEDKSNYKVRPNYENKCSNTEKDKREELHNKCKTKFGELGISEVIDDHEVIEKYSCPAVESALREMTIGCAKYAVSLPADIAKLLGSALGIGRYNKEILETCGKKPKTNFQTSRGPRSKKELKKRRKYYSVYEKYSNCSDKVVVQEKEKAKGSKAHYKKSMARLRSHCTTKLKLTGRAAMAHKRRNLCMLDSMKELEVDCPRCIEELSPSQAGDSGLFKTIAAQLKQFNPAAWNCYTHEKRGALVCAAISTATGAGGAALGAAKVARALGKAAAKNATAKAKKIIARNKKESAVNSNGATSEMKSLGLEYPEKGKVLRVNSRNGDEDLKEIFKELEDKGLSVVHSDDLGNLSKNGVMYNKSIPESIWVSTEALKDKKSLLAELTKMKNRFARRKNAESFLGAKIDPKTGEVSKSIVANSKNKTTVQKMVQKITSDKEGQIDLRVLSPEGGFPSGDAAGVAQNKLVILNTRMTGKNYGTDAYATILHEAVHNTTNKKGGLLRRATISPIGKKSLKHIRGSYASGYPFDELEAWGKEMAGFRRVMYEEVKNNNPNSRRFYGAKKSLQSSRVRAGEFIKSQTYSIEKALREGSFTKSLRGVSIKVRRNGSSEEGFQIDIPASSLDKSGEDYIEQSRQLLKKRLEFLKGRRRAIEGVRSR